MDATLSPSPYLNGYRLGQRVTIMSLSLFLCVFVYMSAIISSSSSCSHYYDWLDVPTTQCCSAIIYVTLVLSPSLQIMQ